jgi:hypothetical protein
MRQLKLQRRVRKISRVLQRYVRRAHKAVALYFKRGRKLVLAMYRSERRVYRGYKIILHKLQRRKANRILLRRFVLKGGTLVAIIALLATELTGIIGTSSYFSDTEESIDNNLSTISLSLNAVAGEYQPAGSNLAIKPNETTALPVLLTQTGAINFKYSTESDVVSGDLCVALELTAMLKGNTVYTGSLVGFSSGAFEFSTPEDWTFALKLTSNNESLRGKACNFNILFKAWQLEAPSYGVGYFTDTAQISGTVTAGTWCLPRSSSIIDDGTVINPKVLGTQESLDPDAVIEILSTDVLVNEPIIPSDPVIETTSLITPTDELIPPIDPLAPVEDPILPEPTLVPLTPNDGTAPIN